MKNSNEFTPRFDNKTDDKEEDVTESPPVFEVLGDIGRQGQTDAFVPARKNLPTFRRLEALRQELAEGADQTDRSQKPEAVVAAPPGVGSETGVPKPSGKFRKFIHLALAGLGLLAGNKVSGEDLSATRAQLDAKNSQPHVFKAPAQSNTNTNVYRYDQQVWRPTTPEGIAKAEKARALLEAQAVLAQAERGSGMPTGGQRPVQNTNQFMNAGVRPEVNRNQQMNPGSFPNPARPQFRQGGGYPEQNQEQFMYGGSYPEPNQEQFMYGGNYPEPIRRQFPNGGNYPHPRQGFPRGSNFQYPNQLPDVVYYGVGPGEQIPTEKRKLFGKEFDAITRNSALYGGDTERRGGNRDGKGGPQRPKKSK